DARSRQGDPAGVRRARRDPGALRSHPRHVRRSHRRRAAARRSHGGQARPAHGRRRRARLTMAASSPSEIPRWVDYLLVPLVNLAVALLLTGGVVLAVGANPLDALDSLLFGAVGYPEAVGYTLYYATNFIFTGLAVAVAFHAGLFNIGGE